MSQKEKARKSLEPFVRYQQNQPASWPGFHISYPATYNKLGHVESMEQTRATLLTIPPIITYNEQQKKFMVTVLLNQRPGSDGALPIIAVPIYWLIHMNKHTVKPRSPSPSRPLISRTRSESPLKARNVTARSARARTVSPSKARSVTRRSGGGGGCGKSRRKLTYGRRRSTRR